MLIVLVLLGPLSAGAQGRTRDEAGARAAGSRFLSRYGLPTGRITRIDQGDDTVSAGQAQGMLVSVALGDRRRFALIWRWTREHLLRRDKLLASHWRRGRVVDRESASDADLDAARALILAAKRFHVSAYRDAGAATAHASLEHETARVRGAFVLVAGPWARTRAILNPGYWAPRTFELLDVAIRDPRFARLEQGVVGLARALTASVPHLPPDWAIVSPTGVARAIAGPPGPRHELTPRYSLDAARMPIRLAEACDASSRALAAAAWPFFAAQHPDRIGLAYRLDGTLIDSRQDAAMLVGAAAAAQAARQTAARDQLLLQAEAVDARYPTYFGAAWIALGRIELETSLLASCS